MKVIKPTKNLSTKATSNFSRLKLANNRPKLSHNHPKLSSDHSAYAILSSITIGSAAFLFGLTYGLICPAV